MVYASKLLKIVQMNTINALVLCQFYQKMVGNKFTNFKYDLLEMEGS